MADYNPDTRSRRKGPFVTFMLPMADALALQEGAEAIAEQGSAAQMRKWERIASQVRRSVESAGRSGQMLPSPLPAPKGCIGPPYGISVENISRLNREVRECAGVPLEKEAVERIAYMVRRAHGLGWAEGRRSRKKNPKAKRKPQRGDALRRLMRGT